MDSYFTLIRIDKGPKSRIYLCLILAHFLLFPEWRFVLAGVLVVDDEKLIRLLLLRALKREGIPVVDASCGSEAIEKIKSKKFDLVILDLRLGDSNGIDILRDLKNSSPETKVIVVTAYGSRDIQNDVMDQGVIGFYEKPFDTSEVIERIKRCLSPTNQAFYDAVQIET